MPFLVNHSLFLHTVVWIGLKALYLIVPYTSEIMLTLPYFIFTRSLRKLVGLYQSFIWQINIWSLIGLNKFPKSLIFIENWKCLLLYSFAPQPQWRSKQDRHYYDLHVSEEKTEAQKSELQEQKSVAFDLALCITFQWILLLCLSLSCIIIYLF